MSHIFGMATIEIPIRELHARTGHFVRLAARNTEVIVTERGKPAARLSSLSAGPDHAAPAPLGQRRKLRADYRSALAAGKLKDPSDSTPALHETAALRDL